MKLLVICPRFPYPLEKGDKLRMYHQLKELANYFEIHLIALTDEIIRKENQQVIELMVEKLYLLKTTKRHRLVSVLKNGFSKLPFSVSYYFHKSIQKKVNEIVNKVKPDHIYCQLTRTSEYVKHFKIPKTIDYMDAFGVGMSRRSEIVNPVLKPIYREEARRMIKYEKEIFPYFDHHTIISQQDRAHIDVENSKSITVIPNGIDSNYFAPKSATEKKYDIGFVGNMGYPPNIDAAECIIKMLKPSLDPDFQYLIAGARPDRRVKLLASDNVKVTGWLDDVRDAYAMSKVFVAPLWSGTGQQNKILEAMAMGIPTITTQSVNNAIGAEDNEEIIVADDQETFIRKIKSILENEALYKKIKHQAREFVVKKYSWKESVGLLVKLIKQN